MFILFCSMPILGLVTATLAGYTGVSFVEFTFSLTADPGLYSNMPHILKFFFLNLPHSNLNNLHLPMVSTI